MQNIPLRIDFYQKIPSKPQAVFAIFYALDGKPWQNHQEVPLRGKNATIPTCLMINRSDGRIGFVGGMVSAGENLEQAVRREVKEEIGYVFSSPLEPLVAYDIGKITTHVFMVELTYESLRQIQKDAVNSEHYGSELTGVFLPHLIDYHGLIDKGGGICNLFKNEFAPSVREELIHFLLKKNIFTKTQLENICCKAGYSLEKLL